MLVLNPTDLPVKASIVIDPAGPGLSSSPRTLRVYDLDGVGHEDSRFEPGCIEWAAQLEADSLRAVEIAPA